MIAIYARQSVSKKDSLSLDMQINTCKRRLSDTIGNIIDDSQIEIYKDGGYSGKTLDRPDFKRLQYDVQNGKISKIYVYKLDRISRSVLDFATMMQDFEKHHTEFISCQEQFDTSTPMGRAMLSIAIVFAQMERETIQQRITDSYYERGRKGFYLGGCAPFGYEKVESVKDGKKTYTFIIKENEANIITGIYQDYAYSHMSFNDIARKLNGFGILSKRGKKWNPQAVSRTLHNPVYVKANADVYAFLRAKGAAMNNPIEDYKGGYGCIVYGKVSDRKSSKFVYMDSDNVVLGMHSGIIPPELWLLAQKRMSQKKINGNLGSGKLSWAQGLVRCKHCDYSCYVKKYKNISHGKTFLYFYCRGKSNGTCKGSKKMLRVDQLEKALEQTILKKLHDDKFVDHTQKIENNEKMNNLKIQLEHINSDITQLISRIPQANEITMKLINQEACRLNKNRQAIENQIAGYQAHVSKITQAFDAEGILENWASFDIEKKSAIAKSFVNRIDADGDEISLKLLF